ncbi:MAG TPA: NAD(P)/FAD-dependent oxidoreductase [Anaeromyxobacter sp.]|nr:NAD(P)/FAD-dependent oxidoreductase [Anaeromyxobacter sp.]
MAAPTVLVIGAGAAGLSAGRALRRAGVRTVILEARERTGGRVDTRQDPSLGIPRERGAEFVHGRPKMVTALAREAGVSIVRVPSSHRLAAAHKGQGSAGARFARAWALFDLARDDRESVAALFARARRERRARAPELSLARSFAEGFYLADPNTASAAALSRMNRALKTIGGDQNYRPLSGWASVLAPLVAEARRPPAELRLGVTATRVRWRPGAVAVEARGLAGGSLPVLRGERLLLTVPLGVLRGGAIQFRPEPDSARSAWGRLDMGPVVKVLLRFRRPPWEERGRSGFAFLHLPGAPVPVFWTLAPRRDPLLVGWVGGPGARRLSGLGESGALRAALRGLAPALGLATGALEDRLDGAELVDWSRDPLSGGGYAVFPVGSAGAPEALSRPILGTLFFAGEATEPDFAGTVDGALRSGERAARQVLESLPG